MSEKLFIIDRDYGRDILQFKLNFDENLRQSGLSKDIFENTVNHVNKVLREQEAITVHSILCNALAWISCFSALLCVPNSYQAAIEELCEYLKHQNQTVYAQYGLEWRNPFENGFVQLELLMSNYKEPKADKKNDDNEKQAKKAKKKSSKAKKKKKK